MKREYILTILTLILLPFAGLFCIGFAMYFLVKQKMPRYWVFKDIKTMWGKK